MVAMFFGLGGSEVLLILVILIIVIGPKKIPELAQALGKSVRELRGAASEFQREFHRVRHEATDGLEDLHPKRVLDDAKSDHETQEPGGESSEQEASARPTDPSKATRTRTEPAAPPEAHRTADVAKSPTEKSDALSPSGDPVDAAPEGEAAGGETNKDEA